MCEPFDPRRAVVERPAVRVNQLGYLPSAPKHATWVTAQAEPAPFAVRAADGSVALRGRSAPSVHRPKPTSDLTANVLDLTPLTTPAFGLRVEASGDGSHPFRIGTSLYHGLSRDALGLFRQLRCRHPDTAVPGWTGPDAERLYPGWRPAGTFDVSGGWYDAGDYGKYVVSGALALWQLLGLLRPLRCSAAEAALVEECRWQLDWLLRMRVLCGQPLAGMAFHRVHGTE